MKCFILQKDLKRSATYMCGCVNCVKLCEMSFVSISYLSNCKKNSKRKITSLCSPKLGFCPSGTKSVGPKVLCITDEVLR